MKPRSLFMRFTSLWLALLVLTSSVGLTVQQHTCHMSGQTQRAVVLAPHHGCAPAEAPVSTQGCQSPEPAKQVVAAPAEKECCLFSAELHKVDAQAAKAGWAQVLMPALPVVWPAPALWESGEAAATLASLAQPVHTDAAPPPRAGRKLLTFVCTLVV